MIVPSDKDYQETKLIKQGKASINPAFKQLAEWIEKKYGVRVLNIYYDTVTGYLKKQFPRLSIIMENFEDSLKFSGGQLGNYEPEKQKAIAKKFDQLVNGKSGIGTFFSFLFRKNKEAKYNSNGLLVIFDAFKPVARSEANEGIPEAEIEKLKTSLNSPEIWKIATFSAGATVFFFTDSQAAAARANGYDHELADKYFALLKQYDEFNYFKREEFSVTLDSKENFDNKYKGSWFNYYR